MVIVVGLDLLLDVLVISNEDGEGLRKTDIGGKLLFNFLGYCFVYV